MKLQGKLENLDGLDESIAGYYTKGEDGYTLNVDLEGTGFMNAFNKVKTERTQLKSENASLAKYKGLDDVEGFDPTKASDYLEKYNLPSDGSVDEKLTEQARQYDKKLSSYEKQVKQFETQLSEKDGLVNQAQQQTKDYIIKTEIMGIAPKAGVLKDGIEDAFQLSKHRFTLDDKQQVQVIDGDGDLTGKTPMEFFTSEFKESKPYLYEASKISGSGSQSNKGSIQNGKDMSSVDKIAAGLDAM